MSTRPTWIVFVPAIAVLGAVAAAHVFLHVRFAVMVRDSATLTDTHPLTGVLSNLGVLMWCAATTICFFSSWLLWNGQQYAPARFLALSGVLSGYLMLDDFFLFHEFMIPQYLGNGHGERAVYLIIALAVCVYVFAFRRIILQAPYALIVFAVALLGTSLIIDAVLAPFLNGLNGWDVFLEDAAKWLGIVCWCAYFANTARWHLEMRREA